MKTINALVVDDSMEFTSSVTKYFENNTKINIFACLNDGREVTAFLKNHKKEIDIILMDLIMPGKDGIAILEELQKESIQKRIIILSSYKKEYAIEKTQKFNVDYYMLKPCDLKSLESRILDLFQETRKSFYKKEVSHDIQVKITELLHNLGVPSQIRGYQYLRDGILMLYESNELIGGITKQVYPEIATRYHTTTSRVERAIRHAIEVSWGRADYQIMNKMFGHSIDFDRAKPTNSEFMVTISDVLKLEDNRLYHYS